MKDFVTSEEQFNRNAPIEINQCTKLLFITCCMRENSCPIIIGHYFVFICSTRTCNLPGHTLQNPCAGDYGSPGMGREGEGREGTGEGTGEGREGREGEGTGEGREGRGEGGRGRRGEGRGREGETGEGRGEGGRGEGGRGEGGRGEGGRGEEREGGERRGSTGVMINEPDKQTGGRYVNRFKVQLV